MYTAKEVAALAGITPASVSNRKNELAQFIVHKNGKFVLYNDSAIEYLLQNQRKKKIKGRTWGQRVLIAVLERHGITRPLPFSLSGIWKWNGKTLGRNLKEAKNNLEKILIENKNKS